MSAKKKSNIVEDHRRTPAFYTALAIHPLLICPMESERKKLEREHGVPVFANHEEYERSILCEAARRCDEQIERAKGGDTRGALRYLDQMNVEIRGTLWSHAAMAQNLKLFVDRASWEIAQWTASSPRNVESQKQMRPVVTFSDSFMTVNCTPWPQSESRLRARQAQNILRLLFENWRDRRNAPIPMDALLRDVTTARLDVALSKNKYPQTWSLIRESVSESTGKRMVWLSDGFEYRVS